MISILNHELTAAQKEELGAVPIHLRELDPELWERIQNCPPQTRTLLDMAQELCNHALRESRDMNCLGRADHQGVILAGSGSPAFNACLGEVSAQEGVPLMYAHSERISEDTPQPDGSIKKVSIFRHVKFFEV